METEHNNLQAMAAIGAFEEACLKQVRGQCRRQVDPPVCQTVTVRIKDKTKQIKMTDSPKPLPRLPVKIYLHSQQKSESFLNIKRDMWALHLLTHDLSQRCKEYSTVEYKSVHKKKGKYATTRVAEVPFNFSTQVNVLGKKIKKCLKTVCIKQCRI